MVVKLLLTLQKNNEKLDNEEKIDRVMRILKYNCEKHYELLLLIYNRRGSAISKEVKKELNLTSNAYYMREQRLAKLGLLKVIPKQQSRTWSRQIMLPQLVHQWFQNEEGFKSGRRS